MAKEEASLVQDGLAWLDQDPFLALASDTGASDGDVLVPPVQVLEQDVL